MSDRKGLFIVLEGMDGSGKSTQARLLWRRLESEGYEALLLHEPGGTPLGEEIGRLLKHSTGLSIVPKAETFLFQAARTQLIEKVILPSLCKGTIVVCDRFLPSTQAYQGYGRGVPEEWIEDVNRLTVGELTPDLVLWLDVDIGVGLERKRGPRLPGVTDRFEDEEISFHQRVREGYRRIASENPGLWVALDASLSIEEVEEEIWCNISKLLPPVTKG